MVKELQQIQPNTNKDIIPKEAWRLIVEPAMRQKGLSWQGFFRALGQQYSSSIYRNGISRERMQRLNTVLQHKELDQLAKSNLFWDQIVSIESLGVEDVYDATVEGVHNFVANDIIVHNSIEQDADIVSFIYRPEYYQILEDEEGQSLKGVAEIIIAKTGHGALDTIKLRFVDQYAKFTDMDDLNFDDLPSDTFSSPFDNTNIITRPSKMNDDEDIPF